ncbi:MAG TPA: hypothetical protein ENI34_00820 [candidate division WOR-3 bacterium]|uniref:peptidylprolyl isomerase n=1 Tax=candidate division WOR-3 bacterium TaxID=2052148 RepID=A0A9C9JZD2_UNCW3|nr:hypothetical protein [candidate division WOR-3 bacterium]
MMLIILFALLTAHADQVAAYVGDDVILESEVMEKMYFLANDPRIREMFQEPEELREYVLDELISQRLVLIEAEQESIAVSTREINEAVEWQIEKVKEQYPSEADFFKALEKQGLTVDDLRRNYERSAKTQLTMERLIQKKFSDITISPIAVKRFYEEHKDSIAVRPGRVKLSHILLVIRPSEDALKKGFNKALDVYKLLLAGGDFSVLAEEFSDDENSKYKGGMLGKIKKGETLEEFEAAVFDLKPGVVSQPIPTRFGYHIVEVLNKGKDWVLARQILIKVGITRADTLRYQRLGERLCELVRQGVDFDSLAKEYSNAAEIDIGEFYVNQLSPPLDSIVENLQEGELSQPILTPIGYHLIYLKEKIPGKTLTFEDMREYIMKYLQDQELQKRFAKLIDELKEKVFVKKFLNLSQKE